MRTCRTIVEEACSDPDPWRGFRSVIERLAALNVRNRGFVDAFLSLGPGSAALAQHRRELLGMLDGLATRAKAQGRLRADFVIDDLVLMLLAGRGLWSVSPSRRSVAARRFAALTVDAFRADGHRSLG